MVRKYSKGLPWDGLEAVHLVHSFGTVRAAAEVANVAHTTIAHRISRLEHALGHSIFAKSKRGYLLTEDGEALLAHVEQMARSAETVQRIFEGSLGQVSGSVRVSVSAGLLKYALTEVVSDLRRRKPGIQLIFQTGDALSDIENLESDIVVRVNSNPPPDLFGRKLCSIMSAVYAPKLAVQEMIGLE